MGSEVRFKSARRCQGKQTHQGNDCIHAAVEKQRSFWDSQVFQTFFQFLGISYWELFIRYESSQALRTQTGLRTVIAMSLSMSVLITGIKSVDFGLIFYTVINQLITIGIIILILHCSSSCSFRGESHVRRAKMQPKAAMNTEGSKNRSLKNISTKNRLASPTSVNLPRISSQSKASLKRDLRGSHSLRYNRQYRKHFRLGRHSISRSVDSFYSAPQPRKLLFSLISPVSRSGNSGILV